MEGESLHSPLVSRLGEPDVDETMLLSDAEILLTPPASPPTARRLKQQQPWSSRALQRRSKLHDAQRQAAERMAAATSPASRRSQRRLRLQKGWQTAKKAINKVNIAKWIDDLEKDQELADQLEQINEEHEAEAERRQLVVRVREECLDALRTHLVSFLQENPEGRYEEWIAEVHPDNVVNEQVDARFFVHDSDHRIMWNEHHVNTEDHAFGFSQMVPPMSVEEKTKATAVTLVATDESGGKSRLHQDDGKALKDGAKRHAEPVIQQV